MKDKTLFKTYVSKMESIKHDRFKNINEDLLNGQNSYIRMRMKGSSFFNDEWIKKIEDCIYELGQIVNNPLEVTTTEGSVTPIELAKKINYESIQHLASHTQYIKEIDEEGNVIPSKILSQFHKEQLHTYENKFIATFIRRLVLFVEKRYDFIRTTVNFDTKEILFIKNKSVVDGKEVEIETKVTVKKPNDDAESKAGRDFVKRVEAMRRYVNYFYSSPFMKELKTEKDVRKPILQTNIIRKNPLYHKCYETFLFIEKFSSLGVEYAVDQNYQEFDEKERKNLTYILSSNLLSLESTEESKVYKKANKVYKPKLLPSCDDEMFLYGTLVKGPIEFVRADVKYIEYLNSRIKQDLPLHPNKAEKIYYKDEYDKKRAIKSEISQIESLLKRVQRQIALWEKKVEKLIAERNLKEAEEAQAQLEALRKEEARILEEKRREIIAAAQGDKSNIKAEELLRKQEEEEKARLKAQEAARKALEELRRQEAEAEAKRIEEENARKAEEERLAKEQEALRLAAEAEALRIQEEAKEQQNTEISEANVEEKPVILNENESEDNIEPVLLEEFKEQVEAQEQVESSLEENKVDESTLDETQVEQEVAQEEPKEVVQEQANEAGSEEPQPETIEESVVVEEANEVQETIIEETTSEKTKSEEQVSESEPQVAENESLVVETLDEEASNKEELTEEQSQAEELVVEVMPVEESSLETAPVVEEESAEEPAQEEAQAELSLEEPVQEEAPAEEPITEEVQEQPAKEEVIVEIPEYKAERSHVSEANKEENGKSSRKAKEKSDRKAKKAKEKPVDIEEEAPIIDTEPRDVFAKIPGRFIVKSNKGYVVSKTQFSNVKSQARIFDDFNEARRYKVMFGGKVIKL